MPELPEVETVARTLYPHVAGCVIKKARLLRPSSLHPDSLPPESLSGLAIKDLRRRGKLLVFDLQPAVNILNPEAAPTSMLVHLRMTGRMHTFPAGKEPGGHARFVWDMTRPDSGALQLVFDDVRAFGKIFIATESLLAGWKFWQELGPEPLELEACEFVQRLCRSRRAIKASLLDQSFIAGIGNIYADEALFKAGIDPHRPSASLARKEGEKLLSAIKEVLTLAIENRGSSIRDYRDADGKTGNFQNCFSVYGRAGKKCPICGTVLKKDRITGRSSVFCPSCQK